MTAKHDGVLTMIRLSCLQHSLKNFKKGVNVQLILQLIAMWMQMQMLLIQKHIFWQILKPSLELLKRSLTQLNTMTKMAKMILIGKCHHQGRIKSVKLLKFFSRAVGEKKMQRRRCRKKWQRKRNSMKFYCSNRSRISYYWLF